MTMRLPPDCTKCGRSVLKISATDGDSLGVQTSGCTCAASRPAEEPGTRATQVKESRNEPGIMEAEVHPTEVHRDGPMRVTLEWDAHQGTSGAGYDGYWFARLTDDDREKRTVSYQPNGDGATREEALAVLAIAAYSGLIENLPALTAPQPAGEPESEALTDAAIAEMVASPGRAIGDLKAIIERLADHRWIVSTAYENGNFGWQVNVRDAEQRKSGTTTYSPLAGSFALTAPAAALNGLCIEMDAASGTGARLSAGGADVEG